MYGLEDESEALVHILTDATAEPIKLSYRFLENITDNFSKDLEIGTGGFGVVYMGNVRNMKVAIKKLWRIDDFSEKQFEDELNCLKRVKHKNIIRFLGYCSETPKEVVVYKGAYVLAECRKRFLCFEYAPNRSLEDYIKDESRQRDWDTSYQLIKGICQGLHYLHNEERINHLDLKPANILLDADMVPKITDFGLSRRFSGEQSRIITEHVRGTPGYMAPEYINKGEISFKSDIYSLGIIISKLLIGRNDDLFDHECWHRSADIVCPRAKACIKIAQLCVDTDQQRRPDIDDIINRLNRMGKEMYGLENESEALVHILTDATAEPIKLSYRFLENITDNFSKDHEIGTGAFGVVYMGNVRNMKVAIKKLWRIDDFSEKQFEDELNCLKRVKHKNIIRFLGYCSETPKEVVVYKGAYVLAECRKRFLCFEYAPNRSLEDYIKDESRQRDWDTCYQLIKGICQGLHYLHNEERINHLDLKPANILLDADMVPKITDFGLSRRFSGEQSRIITEHVRGTPGYIAPEYIDKGEISFKSDIYSLGIIISKLLIGRNDDLFDHECWHKSADIVCPRAKACIKIAQLCVDADQQRRPDIDDIINRLNRMGTLKHNPEFSLEQIQHNGTTSKVTDIYSLEFCFPFKPNKRLHYPMTLTNVTEHYVGVWINTPISANSLVNKSLEDPGSFFLMKPNSTWVTTKEQQRLPSRDTRKFKMMILIMGSSNGSVVSMVSELVKLVKLPQAMLSAVIDNRTNCKIVTTHEAMSPRTSRDGFCLAMDVHPTEPWIIMGHDGGLVSIWNYQTQRRVNEPFQMTTCEVCSVKFIARDQWFAVAAGDAKGWVRVFNNSCFEGNKKVEAFEAHPDKYVDSLAVHPTYPMLLSSSCEDNIIKRWDRHQAGWACTRIFKGHTSGVRCLAFNPSNTNNFASIDVEDVSQVWDINSSNAITPSPVEPEKVDCFFSDRRHRHFTICSDDDQIETAEIWDAQTQDRLQTLGVFTRTRIILKNDIRVKDRDRGNSSEKKSGHGSRIPGPVQIKKASAKNKDKKDSGAKEKNHGGRGDDANNATSASGWSSAGKKGKDQMGSAPTSMPSGHLPPPGNATAGLLDMIFRDPFLPPGTPTAEAGAPPINPIGHPNSSMPSGHLPPPLHYFVHSSEEDPNSCMLCDVRQDQTWYWV